jgi:hypothetical protein
MIQARIGAPRNLLTQTNRSGNRGIGTAKGVVNRPVIKFNGDRI